MKDLHKGQTCLIIGNGPSLNQIPVDFLRRYPTFGTNRIYLFNGFTPTYYASVNPLVIEQSADQIDAMDCTKFIRSDKAHMIAGAYPLYSSRVVTFSKDPLRYVYEGYTVTYVCMQLAYWMGFTTALLVGVDHRFTFEGQPNQEVVSQGDDPNHFAPDYFGKGVVWNNPDLARSEQAYKIAKLNFEKDGRKIVNLTPGSALGVFEREDWQNYA